LPNECIMKCPYCNKPTILRPSSFVYGKNAPDYGWFWLCVRYPRCDAYVGCHPGTQRPLGTLANKSLRNLRVTTHTNFDQLWKQGKISRKESYLLLQDALNLQPEQAHISRLNERECQRIIKLMCSGSLESVIERWKKYRERNKLTKKPTGAVQK